MLNWNWSLFAFPPMFWIFTLGMVLLALAFVLPPLLRSRSPSSLSPRRQINIEVYREQLRDLEAERADGTLDDDQFEAARRELEIRLADDALAQQDQAAIAGRGKGLAIAVAIFIPLLAFGIYFLIGNPWAIEETARAIADGQHDDPSTMLDKLRTKAERNPDDGRTWLMLAKTYAAMERWQDADQAYAKTVTLLPYDAAVLAGYAESQAILKRRVLQGRPMELVRQALEINPSEPKALELAGINAFQEQEFAQAAYFWKQLLKQLPPDSPLAMDIALALKDAKGRAEAALGQPLDKLLGTDQFAGMTINGTLGISPSLKGKIPANATVFLFAKPLDGGMPAAAIKAAAKDLPLEFELNDTMRIDPNSKLSAQKEVSLIARISISGDAVPKSGDLEGVLTPVKVGEKNIRLVIDTARP
jgi:cytochrome c-type biogenesis protein CcmH